MKIGDKCLAHGCGGVYVERVCKSCGGNKKILVCDKCNRRVLRPYGVVKFTPPVNRDRTSAI